MYTILNFGMFSLCEDIKSAKMTFPGNDFPMKHFCCLTDMYSNSDGASGFNF